MIFVKIYVIEKHCFCSIFVYLSHLKCEKQPDELFFQNFEILERKVLLSKVINLQISFN